MLKSFPTTAKTEGGLTREFQAMRLVIVDVMCNTDNIVILGLSKNIFS